VSIKDYSGLITDRTAKMPVDWGKVRDEGASIGRKTVKPDKAALRARGRVRKRSGEMNRTEASFAERLKIEQLSGSVLWWAFEAMKFRLADNTFYTPDFAVLYSDGMLRLIDTKGTTKKDGKYKPFVEEDAAIKMKICAETFPISFAVAFRLPKSSGGEWVIKEV